MREQDEMLKGKSTIQASRENDSSFLLWGNKECLVLGFQLKWLAKYTLISFHFILLFSIPNDRKHLVILILHPFPSSLDTEKSIMWKDHSDLPLKERKIKYRASRKAKPQIMLFINPHTLWHAKETLKIIGQ